MASEAARPLIHSSLKPSSESSWIFAERGNTGKCSSCKRWSAWQNPNNYGRGAILRATRRGGLRPTSPSCRSCCGKVVRTSTPAAAKLKIRWKATFIKTGDQKNFEMPYPSAAIQTPFTAAASPMPATGQAVRIALAAFAPMPSNSPIQSPS